MDPSEKSRIVERVTTLPVENNPDALYTFLQTYFDRNVNHVELERLRRETRERLAHEEVERSCRPIIQELSVTERTYFEKNLTPLQSKFLGKWTPRMQLKFEKLHPSSPKDVVDSLCKVSSDFLACQSSSVEGVIEAFRIHAVAMARSFSRYARIYNSLIHFLNVEKSAEFRKLVDFCGGPSQISSWLIAPIQRPPRYGLLLNQMLLQVPQDERGGSKVNLVLSMMNVVATCFNEWAPDSNARSNSGATHRIKEFATQLFS